MRPVWDNRVAEWVGRRIEGGERGFGECKAMGVMHGEALVAGIVFHNWSPEAETIEVTAAADHRAWATRSVLNEGFGYVFSFCQAAVARTSVTNMPVRRLWKAFGANEYIIPRLRGRNAAEAIYLLTDDQWSASKFRR